MEATIHRNTTEAVTGMLADSMGALVDALQELSDRIAPELGAIGEREYRAPSLYGNPALDSMQTEAAWADALAQRIERIGAHLAALPQ